MKELKKINKLDCRTLIGRWRKYKKMEKELNAEKKIEIDITYNIEKIDSFFDEEKINKFVNYILKDEYSEDFDKNEYYLSLLITTNLRF